MDSRDDAQKRMRFKPALLSAKRYSVGDIGPFGLAG